VVDFAAQKEGRIDFAANRPLLENVRLWDWRAFHDTLSQSQPLRPYTYATLMSTATRSTAACARPCSRPANWISTSGRCAQSLD